LCIRDAGEFRDRRHKGHFALNQQLGMPPDAGKRRARTRRAPPGTAAFD
jgi:hypothetical protein